jgi:hypothetical protein
MHVGDQREYRLQGKVLRTESKLQVGLNGLD